VQHSIRKREYRPRRKERQEDIAKQSARPPAAGCKLALPLHSRHHRHGCLATLPQRAFHCYSPVRQSRMACRLTGVKPYSTSAGLPPSTAASRVDARVIGRSYRRSRCGVMRTADGAHGMTHTAAGHTRRDPCHTVPHRALIGSLAPPRRRRRAAASC
jgi:hypothetical protein